MRLMSDRGDTIIEVIFAITIFSFVAITSLMIMNQGIATGERALEITLVRQQINAQAEALRYIHESRVMSPDAVPFAATWNKLITTYAQPLASPYGPNGTECVMRSGGGYKPFILNAKTAALGPAPTIDPNADDSPPYPQVLYEESDPLAIRAAYGLWVESVPSSVVVAQPFVDFHIRSCWYAPGSTSPLTLGTIVRLYDPR